VSRQLREVGVGEVTHLDRLFAASRSSRSRPIIVAAVLFLITIVSAYPAETTSGDVVKKAVRKNTKREQAVAARDRARERAQCGAP
jgi:hypothetical protein